MPQNDWDNIPTDRHTKFLFIDNIGLVAKSNYINELKQYAKANGYKHFTIVLNDKCQTNIIF